MAKFINHGEPGKTFDYKQNGIFDELYSVGSGGEVPRALRQCEMLKSDMPIVATAHGMLNFAGVVRARPYGFLPYSLFVTNSGPTDIERVTVCVPLCRFFEPRDENWPERIIGGSWMRKWQELGYCMLAGREVVEDDFADLELHVGALEVLSVRGKVRAEDDPDIATAIDLLQGLPRTVTIATSSIDIVSFAPETCN